jgi:hypothetical protein
LENVSLSNIEISEEIVTAFSSITNAIEDKTQDLFAKIVRSAEIQLCKLFIATSKKILENNEAQIVVVNNTKNNTNIGLRFYRRFL